MRVSPRRALRNGYGEAHPDVDAAQSLLVSLESQQSADGRAR